MTAHIRILPSGREFESEGNQSLLEAGLGAGLRLGYGCSNGNCGKCVARVISGEVQKIRHHDFHIGEAKKASGHVLMCCNTPVTDMLLEACEASGANEVPQQQITAKVKSINIVNADVALIHMRTPRTNRLRFLAGQHVRLGGNELPVATHSVASCPCDDMQLHFQIPRVADDAFSGLVFDKLKHGDLLNIIGPGGDFILNEDSPRPLVFIAWRTGFAPVRSLIEHAMALDVAKTIHLVWIAKDKEDRYLDNLCRSWADALDGFHYLPVDVDAGDVVDDISLSILNRLNSALESLADHDFYIAGNNVFTASFERHAAESGLSVDQLALDTLEHD